MARKKNLLGQKFSHLTVIGYADDYVSPKDGAEGIDPWHQEETK